MFCYIKWGIHVDVSLRLDDELVVFVLQVIPYVTVSWAFRLYLFWNDELGTYRIQYES